MSALDGVDGIDNALAGLLAITDLAGIDLNQLLTAITFRFVRLQVRLDRCGATPTLVMVDSNGAPIGAPREAEVVLDSNGGSTCTWTRTRGTAPPCLARWWRRARGSECEHHSECAKSEPPLGTFVIVTAL